MKIVTYNVNGLRPRISQFGSLRKLLDSLDADIICFQETKLAKQELRADVVWADGYESFFSCTRTFDRGRTGYSGVATFCRVNSAFSSEEVALPLDAEEGITGLLENSRGLGTRKDNLSTIAEGLEGLSRDELLKVDSEGRCIITDHGHFVLFNIYGPRAECNDTERIQFKHTFFKILKRRWESLLHDGRRVFVVGDLNIAPSAIDRCDAGPDFEKNEFRGWLRSLLVENGGPFYDVFRAKHPERKEAYTCWPTNSGAEIFNFGARIDHILGAGSCLHEDHNLEGKDFFTCHVIDCDISTQFKRWKAGDTTRWKGGRGIKLKGSDHAPVYMCLKEIPNILQHSTPLLSTRYCPQVQGCQQTLVSMLFKRQSAEQIESSSLSSSSLENNTTVQSCNDNVKRPSSECNVSAFTSNKLVSSSNLNQETKKKARQSELSQLSLKSFFQKSSKLSDSISSSPVNISLSREDASNYDQYSNQTSINDDESNTPKQLEAEISASIQEQDVLDACHPAVEEKRNVALAEWRRIQEVMQNSIPLCKGHNEPCVARVVKKPGPNLGRRFFVCARAEGPASNPEANCGYFKWTASKSKHKGGR